MVTVALTNTFLPARSALRRGAISRRAPTLRRVAVVKPAACARDESDVSSSRADGAARFAAALASAAVLTSAAPVDAASFADIYASATSSTPHEYVQTSALSAADRAEARKIAREERERARATRVETAKTGKLTYPKVDESTKSTKKVVAQKKMKKKTTSAYHPGPVASVFGYSLSLLVSTTFLAGAGLYATGRATDEAGALDVFEDVKTRVESIDDKPVTAAYALGALVTLAFIDGMASLPVIGWILSPTLTLAGILTTGAAVVRYGVDGAADFETDAKYALARVNDAAPEPFPKMLGESALVDEWTKGVPLPKPTKELVNPVEYVKALKLDELEPEKVAEEAKEKLLGVENKAVVAGYGAAFFALLWASNFVLSVPVVGGLVVRPALHGVGIAGAGLLALRYAREGGDVVADIKSAVVDVNDAVATMDIFPAVLTEETAQRWRKSQSDVRSNVVTFAGKKKNKKEEEEEIKKKKMTTTTTTTTTTVASSASIDIKSEVEKKKKKDDEKNF